MWFTHGAIYHVLCVIILLDSLFYELFKDWTVDGLLSLREFIL